MEPQFTPTKDPRHEAVRQQDPVEEAEKTHFGMRATGVVEIRQAISLLSTLAQMDEA